MKKSISKDVVFNFPRTKFVGTSSAGEQLQHVLSEAKEIKAELKAAKISVEALDMEVVDLLHSIETYLRIKADAHGQEFLNDLFNKVELKNQERGYYLRR